MEKVKLSNHIKKGDTLYTPYTNPDGFGSTLSLSSWSQNWLPEFLWIGLIIHNQGRKSGLQKIYHIINELNAYSICIPQFSKICELEREQRKHFWSIVLNHVRLEVLAPFAIVVTPDIDDVFYNIFFDYAKNIDECISELLAIIKECNMFCCGLVLRNDWEYRYFE